MPIATRRRQGLADADPVEEQLMDGTGYGMQSEIFSQGGSTWTSGISSRGARLRN